MLEQVVITEVADGPRHYVIHVAFRGNGGGELFREVLVDLGPRAKAVVEEITYEFVGFDAILGFDAGNYEPDTIWVLSEGGANGHLDFTYFGGIKDRSDKDGQGKIVITTSGFDSTADWGSMLLKIRKA